MKHLNEGKCIVCGEDKWTPLPEPNDRQSITTACTIIQRPLGKAHCNVCGLVQKVYDEPFAESDYYESNYKGYYDRPATQQYHMKRYEKMVEWITRGIEPLLPSQIFDVGCGQGGAMLAMKDVFPDATIIGLEPSLQNSTFAKQLGFSVLTQRMGADVQVKDTFDLVFAIYVLQHVADPVDFLLGLKNAIHDEGLMALVVPNGDTPNIELLWSDQNYAFAAGHVIALAEIAGLSLVALLPSPSGISNSWLIILGKDKHIQVVNRGEAVPAIDPVALLEDRATYLQSFKDIDAYLCRKARGKKRIVNFGASFWTSILGAYCPGYWDLVDFCAVDGGSGEMLGKGVVDFQALQLGAEDTLVLGLAKDAQKAVSERLIGSEYDVVSWYKWISW